MLKFCWIYFVISIYQCSAQLQSDTLVVTNSGPVRGKRYEYTSKFNRRTINSFIGIPYSRPPVGDLRFQLPQQPEVWKTEKDVTNNYVMCPQVYQRFDFSLNNLIREDEDCLYLNIFVPLGTVCII
ncbi:fatty acyl-CoA hydrolase precursor, medium chain-like [Oppia nitens]|uniref:fatty acyl-CoA hydrolase precursor, medium chain-like n=1 Tax=Oppia nitens TaxID=1686743 RepID=UPI0023DBF559|nr:fatty acyl-CoA hydrolase precursor, medium chain-like [Oppia nitens]